MALFNRWKNTVEKLTHPVVQEEQNTEVATEDEASIFAKAFLECLTNLEHRLHGMKEPKEIGLSALAAACDFYDADWCGVLDVDVKLKLWMPFWWFDRKTGGMSATKIDEIGVVGIYERWMDALENNHPIIIDCAENIRNENPGEYNLFSQHNTETLLAVPYNKKEKGFLMVRNPKRYLHRPELLQILSYALVSEVNEQKLLDRMKMSVAPKMIQTDNEVIINLFGGLEIYTSKGKLTEAEFKSPLCCKVLLLLMMNRNRGVSARELSEQLWPDKEYDNPTGNIRTLLYRFRSAFRIISDTDLIVTTPNGYRINTNLKIETDFERFEQGYHMAKKMQGKQEKIDTLKEIVKLYRGKMFLTGSAEHWQIAYISKFHLMYLAAIEMLMELLYEKQAYGVMHEYATRAISVEPDNPSIIYWLIVALRKYGAADMAKEHLESAKIRLLAEEYQELEGRLMAV